MSENDIKPVAWVDLACWKATNDAGESFFTDYQDEETVALYDQSAIDRLSTQLKHYRMAAEAEATLADRRQQEIDRLRVMLAEAEAARDRAQDDVGRYRILRDKAGLAVRDVFNARWLRDNGNPETLDAALDIFATGSGAES